MVSRLISRKGGRRESYTEDAKVLIYAKLFLVSPNPNSDPSPSCSLVLPLTPSKATLLPFLIKKGDLRYILPIRSITLRLSFFVYLFDFILMKIPKLDHLLIRTTSRILINSFIKLPPRSR